MVRSRKFLNRTMQAILVIGSGGLLVLGCDDRDSVKVYQAPKEVVQQIDPAAQMGSPDGPSDAPALPQWVLPEGWVQVPPGQMQKVAFAVDAADPQLTVGLSTFGKTSPVLDNVTRWEGQLGLPKSTDADLSKVVTHTQNNGLEIDSVDLKSPGQTDGRRIIASIISNAGQQWFLKFDGQASKLEAHKSQYDAFLKSITFSGTPAVAGSTATPGATPGAIPGATSGDQNQPPIEGYQSYKTPDGWVLDPEPKMMRLATFHIGGNDQQADVILTRFGANNFGTAEMNMNRWLGEVGLPPVTDAGTVPHTPVTAGGGTGFTVDLTGPDSAGPAAKQLVVAQITKGNWTYFIKMIGSSKLVEQQKQAFSSFVRSVQFSAD